MREWEQDAQYILSIGYCQDIYFFCKGMNKVSFMCRVEEEFGERWK